MILYRARLETKSFSFEAFGRTEAVAISYLIDALYRHAEQYNLEPNWFAQDRESFVLQKCAPGLAYRDGQLI